MKAQTITDLFFTGFAPFTVPNEQKEQVIEMANEDK